MLLNPQTLAQAKAERPDYDRSRVTAGIVHLGIGNFHRAHQAHYIDQCLASDPSWGIRGVSLRRPDMHDALAPQRGLYTLATRDGCDTCLRVIGSVLDVLVAPQDVDAVIEAMADPGIRIVSLTVTEKGYCHDPASGDLDAGNAAIKADLARPDAPSTAPGLVIAALRRRRERAVAPFALLSCDNLPANGRTLARILTQYASMLDDALATWVGSEVACPSTMVDRIVPATTAADRSEVAARLGLEDAWPVITEPFSQWIVEDCFPAGRPPLDSAGAQFVGDVEPFERMKLRMLNGAHSTLAYFGQRLGCETVAEAMANAGIARLVDRVMAQAATTLGLPAADLAAYAETLKARFRNPALKHRTEQIAMDGSQKIPQRLLATIRDAERAGKGWDALALGVAAWIDHVRRNRADDPLAARLAALAAEHRDTRAHARAVLSLRDVFGDLSDADWFHQTVVDAVVRLADAGAENVLKQ